jgi:hypothetical protein
MAATSGFDLIAQEFAGRMSITGEPDGPPAEPENSVADCWPRVPRCRPAEPEHRRGRRVARR